MHPKHTFYVKPLHEPVLDHGKRPSPTFLRWLKDNSHCTSEIARSTEVSSGSKEHGHVTIVPAGMRTTGYLRRPGFAASLKDRQGIHICPQPDDRPLAQRSFDKAHNPGFADTSLNHIATELREFVSDETGSRMDVVEKFRVLVEMTPPGNHVITHLTNTVRKQHLENPMS
jgi:hypothetical protein